MSIDELRLLWDYDNQHGNAWDIDPDLWEAIPKILDRLEAAERKCLDRPVAPPCQPEPSQDEDDGA